MERLVRGQRIKITDVTSANLLEVRLRFQSSNNLRIDACCFGLDADGRLSDDRYFIFYNQNASPENSLTLRGGAETPTFHIDLSLIPNHVRRLVFAITVGGEGVLSNLGSSHLVLVANGRPAAAYNFSGADVESEKALMVSEVYYKDTWRFAAVCQGFNGGLAALLKHFGGEIVEEESRADIPGGNISLTSPIQSQMSVPSTPAVLSMPQPPAPPAPPTISPGRSCIRCAKEPGFLGGLTGFNLQTRRCAKCEREVQSTLSNFIQMFRSYASGVVLTESQWQELRQVLDRERISWQEGMAAARTEAEELIASTLKMIASDNAIMPEEERYLHQLHTALLISPQVAQASLKELEQLKELIRLRLGFLPTVIPTVHLDSDEQCYLETDATYLKVTARSTNSVYGRLVVTNKKINFASSTNGWNIQYKNVMKVRSENGNYSKKVCLELATRQGSGCYQVADPLRTEAIIDTATRIFKRQLLLPESERDTRSIPQHVKTAVWQRDGGKCTECSAATYLEFDHVIPVSKGGATSIGNLQLLCRNCNLKKRDRI